MVSAAFAAPGPATKTSPDQEAPFAYQPSADSFRIDKCFGATHTHILCRVKMPGTMDLRELRAFVAVADELSFTKAAERLHVAQPPLTRQIQNLEEELDLSLFVRTSRGVSLTTEGQRLLERARMIMRDAETFLELARRVKDENSGIIRVGLGWGLWEAYSRVRTFHRERFPGAIIDAEDLHSDAQSEALREGRIDVGISWGVRNSPHLLSEPIFQAQMIVLISSLNPLSRRSSVKIADIANEKVILMPQGLSPNIRDKTLALYEAAAITPPLASTPQSLSARKNMIASGSGVHFGVLSPFVQPYSYHSGIATVFVDEPDATVDAVAAWRAHETSETIVRFMDTARKTFAEVAHRV